MKNINEIRMLFIAILICTLSCSMTDGNKKWFFANANRNIIFVFNFEDNRFCYFDYRPYELLGSKYCSGDLKIIGDTLILKSDFDIMNLPIHVLGKSNNCLDTTKIDVIFNIHSPHDNSEWPEKIIRDYKEMSYVIINNNDTISLKNDSILYKKPIKSFFVAGFIKPLSRYELERGNAKRILLSDNDTVIRRFIRDHLEELEKDSAANPPIIKSQIIYKTLTYNNVKNYNQFNLSLDIFNDNYQTINDTIIFQKDKCFYRVNNKGDTIEFRQYPSDSLLRYSSFLDSCTLTAHK